MRILWCDEVCGVFTTAASHHNVCCTLEIEKYRETNLSANACSARFDLYVNGSTSLEPGVKLG